MTYCRNCSRRVVGSSATHCPTCAYVPTYRPAADEDGLDEDRGAWVLDPARRVMVWRAA